MDEKDFISLENDYSQFRENLNKEINNFRILIGIDDCYIIDEYWNNQLVNCFKKYNISKNISLPKTFPDFINDNTTLINCIKNKIKFKLIKKDIIYKIYKENDLKINNLVTYYGGKGKLIIEYKNIKEDSILIINPLEEVHYENNIFFISTNRKNNKYP